jgi:hypothetical protein
MCQKCKMKKKSETAKALSGRGWFRKALGID